MNGIKLGFNMIDLARSWGRGYGSVRLKDGSSLKILGSTNEKVIDFFRVKNGRLLDAKGYRGEDAIYKAANDMGYIEEKLAQNPQDAQMAWAHCYDVNI